MAADELNNNQGDSSVVLAADTIISHYKIISKIGSGGMGDVYQAVDTRLNRPVAIKTLRQEFFKDLDKAKRLDREAVTAARINHPNIMSIYDIGELKLQSGQSLNYIVMEYIEGKTLRSHLKDSRPAFIDLIHLCEKLGSALAAAHKMGVVHRDIKLDNIIINADGEPKILDFGLAKPVSKAFVEDSTDGSLTESLARELTGERKIIGTISYMSPEQARGEKVDHRSDIFSFGILMYYVFTGKLPFEGSDRVSTIAKILEAPYEPIRIIDESFPAELERIINKCLQKKPDDRYQDSRDLVVDLRSLRRQFDSNVSDSISGIYESSPGLQKKGKKIAGIPLPVILIAIAVLVIVSLWRLFMMPTLSSKQSDKGKGNALAILSFENLSEPDDPERYGQILQELVLTDLADNVPMQLISSQRLFDIQKNLGYRDRSKIDRDIATEVARRAGAHVMISGNLIQTAGKWIVTCQLADVNDGTIIQSHRLEGSDIFNIVDDLSGLVRKDLTPAAEREDSDLSVKEKTSVSMEAFRHYLAGNDLLGETEYEKAIDEYKKAVEIDPEFNKAYYKMAIAQWWLDDVASEAGKKSILKILNEKRYSSERERLMASGAMSLMEGQYGEALNYYQQLVDRYPDDKEVWYGYGEALYHYSSQTRRKSLEAFEQAIELDVGFVLAYRHVFDLYFDFGRYDQALIKAKNLIEVKPESPMGYRYRAKAAIYKGDSGLIESSITQALRHHTDPDEHKGLYLELFSAFVHARSLAKAIEFSRKAFEADPQMRDAQRVRIWGELVRLFESAKNSKSADSVLNVALISDIAPEMKSSLISNLAQSYFSDIRLRKKAWSVLEQGMQMETSAAGAVIWAAASQLALNERRYEDAEQYARKALTLATDEHHDWASNTLHESYLYRGDYENALELSLEWQRKFPQLIFGYLAELKVYVYSRQFERADSILQKALETIEIPAQIAMLLHNAAVIYRDIEYYDKALSLFQQVCDRDSSQLDALTWMGRINEFKGNYKTALKYYDRILAKDSTDINSMIIIARVYLRMKDYVTAEEWLRKALEFDSSDAGVHRMFGYLYSAQEQYDKALTHASQAFDESGSFYSYNLMAWLRVAGDFDLDSGITLAQTALNNPPSGSPFDLYVHESPFVPLPDHTLGLAHMKKGEYRTAVGYLERAARLRPDDIIISEDLSSCRDKLRFAN